MVTARDHRAQLMARVPAPGASGAARAGQLEAMADGVFVYNCAGRVLQTNAVLRNLLALDVHTGFLVWPLRREDGMP